jgi:multiple sugar transport system substrate-binding protein
VSRPARSRRDLFSAGGRALLVGAGAAAAACTPKSEPAAPAARRDQTGTLTIWGVTRFPFDSEVGGEIARDFQNRSPGVKVEYAVPSGDAIEKLRVASAGGTPPELASVNGWSVQGLALDGVVVSMEPYLKQSKALKKADLWPALVQEESWKGALHGMAYAPDVRILYANADRYARAGLDADKPPKTWAELENSVAKALQRDGSAITILGFDPFIGSGQNNLWLVPFWQLGGDLLSADGTKVTIANDKGLAAWTWIKKVIDMQGGWSALVDFKKGKEPNALFANNLMGSYYATTSERSESILKVSPTVKFGFATYPLPPNGRHSTFGGVHTFVIGKGSKLADTAWLFLEHFLSEENNLRFADTYDRVPVRQSVATSAAYLRNDPFRKLTADEMTGRKWLIPAPGAADMRADVMNVVVDILEKNMSIPDALSKAQSSIQNKLDAALSAAK